MPDDNKLPTRDQFIATNTAARDQQLDTARTAFRREMDRVGARVVEPPPGPPSRESTIKQSDAANEAAARLPRASK